MRMSSPLKQLELARRRLRLNIGEGVKLGFGGGVGVAVRVGGAREVGDRVAQRFLVRSLHVSEAACGGHLERHVARVRKRSRQRVLRVTGLTRIAWRSGFLCEAFT